MINRIPPSAIDLEELVLGALMLDSTAFMEVSDILKPEVFYKESHLVVFEAITTLINSDRKVDIATVTEQLRSDKKLELVGGAYSVAMIMNRVAGSNNIRTHAQIIYEKYLAREIINVCSRAIDGGFTDGEDAFDLLASAQDQLYKLSEITITKTEKLSDTFLSHVDEMEKQYNDENHNIGLSTGFKNIDHYLLGLCPAHLIIIGGKPGEGKTTLALQIILNAVESGSNVGFFSLEMSRFELQNKIISNMIEVDSRSVRKSYLNKDQWNRLHENKKRIGELGLWIDDTGGLTLNELKSKSRVWVYKHGIQAIFIDYLQLIKADRDSKFGSREERVTHVANELKSLSKNLNVPIIALSQLARKKQGEAATKKPGIEDLRESGGIEQAADEILLMFRYEYHGVTEWQTEVETDRGKTTVTELIPHGLVECIVGKNRNGNLGEAYCLIDLPTGRFKDYKEEKDQQQIEQSALKPYPF